MYGFQPCILPIQYLAPCFVHSFNAAGTKGTILQSDGWNQRMRGKGNGNRTNHMRLKETTKKQYIFLSVTHECVPKDSPNQNKDFLYYEPDLGKMTRQTRKWIMQIKEEKLQLHNQQNIMPELITTWPFPVQTGRSRNRADRLHPGWEPARAFHGQ